MQKIIEFQFTAEFYPPAKRATVYAFYPLIKSEVQHETGAFVRIFSGAAIASRYARAAAAFRPASPAQYAAAQWGSGKQNSALLYYIQLLS